MRLCGMRCAKGDDANGATAQGRAVPSEGRCDPVAPYDHPDFTSNALCEICSALP